MNKVQKIIYPTATQTMLPIPKVIAAAARPKIICLNPEYQTFFPVKSVIAAQMINNPIALDQTLTMIAGIPERNINGATGIIAPMEKRINE